MKLSVMYRGWLSSCNYGCSYCPFAKRKESADRLRRDRNALLEFTSWIERHPQHAWKILFTPWGEALVRPAYRRAAAALSLLPQVETVALQTNLSCDPKWIAAGRPERLALWATYHPTEVDLGVFVARVRKARELGAAASVGVVGVAERIDAVVALRKALPAEVYLWINAQQPRPRPYTARELDLFRAIDPHFDLTAGRRPSLGRACPAGETSFTVDGKGEMRRCHFVDAVIGDIHRDGWEQALVPRPCPRRTCDCFLGKAQLEGESLRAAFGDRLLERLPVLPASFG